MSERKNLFELFPEYTEEEIIKAFNELTVNIKELLIQTYGPDLKEKINTDNLTTRKKRILETTLEKTLIRQLKSSKKRNKKNKNQVNLSNDVITDTINRLDYKPLTKNQETRWLKKLKLAFYYNVDTDTQKKYIKYYCEVKPKFKEKYENADEKEKEKLLKEAIKDANEEKKKFIENNERLIITAIYRNNDDIPKEELMQEANIGLIKALEKFDIETDYKFSTYAVWWIKQSINRYIANNGKTIRVPSNTLIQQKKLIIAQAELEEQLQRKPTIEELAKYTNISKKMIKLMQENLAYQTNLVSLNEPFQTKSMEKETTLENSIPDETSDFTEETENKIIIEELKEIIKKLDKNSQFIINMRMGLIDGKVHTLDEIASHLGITREGVRLSEIRILKKIKEKYESNINNNNVNNNNNNQTIKKKVLKKNNSRAKK